MTYLEINGLRFPEFKWKMNFKENYNLLLTA
jgi:hypothetical protein